MHRVRTYVVSVDGLCWGLKSQSNILKPPLVAGGNLLSSYMLQISPLLAAQVSDTNP